MTRQPEAAPEPKPRRRSGETGKAFGPAAKAAMQRTARIPAQAYAATTAYLSDTLDWLNLWNDNSGMDDSGELDDNYNPQQNHSSPHL